MNYIDFNITVRFSETPDRYGVGAGESHIAFVIPEEMYSGANFIKLLDKAIKEAEKAYPEAKKEWEERQAQYDREYAERQKAKEAEKLNSAN